MSLAVVTALATQALQPRYAVAALLFLIAADIAVLFVFGRYLIERLVLKPMGELTAAADELAAGRLERRAPSAETSEFNLLAERLNGMTEALLDAHTRVRSASRVTGQVTVLSLLALYLGRMRVMSRREGEQQIETARSHRGSDLLCLNIGSYYGWIRNCMGVENVSLIIYDDPALFEEMVAAVSECTYQVCRPFSKHLASIYLLKHLR